MVGIPLISFAVYNIIRCAVYNIIRCIPNVGNAIVHLAFFMFLQGLGEVEISSSEGLRTSRGYSCRITRHLCLNGLRGGTIC